jgi:hypothetical protein
VRDLERQLARVAQHNNTDLTFSRLDLRSKAEQIPINLWYLFLNVEQAAQSSLTWCRVASTNTAVLPIPDLAWQMMSMPSTAWGMHSCWTVYIHQEQN